MMDIRLVALDLDGTLMPQSQIISPRTRAAVARAQEHGLEIVCTTGRALSEMGCVFEQLPPMRYACCCTGAYVTDLRTGENISSTPLSAQQGREIYAALREYNCLIHYFSDGAVRNDRQTQARFLPHYPAALRALLEQTHVCEEDLDAYVAAYSGPVDKLYVNFLDASERDAAFQRVQDMGYYVTDAGFVDFEIMHSGVDKATALSALAAHLGVSGEQVCAIGDSGNDVPMLRWAGLGVAMGNAAPGVQAEADYVTADNEHDGVADVLDRLLNGGF